VSSFGTTTLSVSLEAAFAKELFMEGSPRVDVSRIPSCYIDFTFLFYHTTFQVAILYVLDNVDPIFLLFSGLIDRG
jgi:hypothetical protein